MYKPSDVVQFRVLILDQETKPFDATNVDLFITDGENNRLKQYLNAKLDHGVFKNELKLSDSPVLGKWHINVKVDGEKETKKSFEVAKYVLPKFEVSVSSDSYLTFKDDSLKVTVNAKYTYGKNVKGNATITVKKSNSWGGDSTSKKTAVIDGKKTIEFDLQKDLKLTRDEYSTRELEIEVKVVEDLTGNEQIGKSTTSVYRNRHTIEVSLNKPNFKPGLPYEFNILGKYRDGTPVTDEHNEVKVTISYWQRPLKHYCDNTPHNETQNASLKNGVATIHFNPAADVEHLKINVEYLSITDVKKVPKHTSSGDNYIQAIVKSKK